VPVLESFAVQKAEDGTVSFTSEVWSPAPDTAVLMTLHNAEGGVVRKLRLPCETEPCSVASEALRLPPGCYLVRVTAVDGSDGTSEEFTETFNIPSPSRPRGRRNRRHGDVRVFSRFYFFAPGRVGHAGSWRKPAG